jgi:hypothetical protein
MRVTVNRKQVSLSHMLISAELLAKPTPLYIDHMNDVVVPLHLVLAYKFPTLFTVDPVTYVLGHIGVNCLPMSSKFLKGIELILSLKACRH